MRPAGQRPHPSPTAPTDRPATATGVTFGLTLNGAALTAEGGVIGGTDHGTPYIAGSGVYDGSYEVAYRHAGDTEISTDSGAISLVADFDTASLSGAAGDLTISGVISGVTLSGDVTHDGMAGTLTGGVIGRTWPPAISAASAAATALPAAS